MKAARRPALLLASVVCAGGVSLGASSALAQVPSDPAPPPGDGLSAGGLTPPPPITEEQDPNAPPTQEQTLDQAKEKDSGRGLTWFWINLEGGFQHVGLQTFNVDEEAFTAGFVETSASGGVIGAGLGARLLFVTIGPRARLGFFGDWQLFSLGGELGFHIPIGSIEPHFDLGFGYTGLGSVSGAVSGASDAIDIRGVHARVGGGLDYFVTPAFSVGGNFSWEFLALSRPGLSAAEIDQIQSESPDGSPDEARADLLAAEGSGYGSSIALTAVAGLHF